jgi:threonyl-tRNA synthetase
VRVITLNDDEALINYAKPIVAELRANRVRVDSDFSATPFKAKIAEAEKLRVHTMLVIGGPDMEAGAVNVRLHRGGPPGAKPKTEVVAEILAGIKERRAQAKGQPSVNFRCGSVEAAYSGRQDAEPLPGRPRKSGLQQDRDR